MRVLPYLASLLISVFLLSCSSTSEGDSNVKEEVAAGKKIEDTDKADLDAAFSGEPEEQAADCSAPPVPVMCCQAMTPACNECREKSRSSMEAWRKTCGPKVKAEGCGAPPVVNCCKGPAEECKTCRDETQLKITAWRKLCGTKDAIDCSDKPSTAQCCITGQPSCDACRKRIGRLLLEFSRKCDK